MKAKKMNSLASKFGYASGDVLGGGAFALVSLLFLNYLVTVEGISAVMAGTIVMLGKVWDAISDPLMGALSDRTSSRFGRRRIYIISGMPLIILTFTMLWYSFGIEGTTAKFIYYTVAYMLFSTAFTIVMVPYNALLPDMVGEYKARAGYTTIRMFISNLSVLISVVLPGMLLKDKTSENFLLMGFIFSLFYALPLIITFFTTWEAPVDRSNDTGGIAIMLRQLSDSFKNRAYRQYLGIFVAGQMATDLVTTLMAFWLADVVV